MHNWPWNKVKSLENEPTYDRFVFKATQANKKLYFYKNHNLIIKKFKINVEINNGKMFIFIYKYC